MNSDKMNSEVDGYYCPEIQSRWKSYNSYKLILWVWMVNEASIVFTPTEISHNGFYAHAAVQAVSVILIGMPLAYSEICLGQYTNCNVFTVWDFFPLFRNVGYASYYLIFIKALYLLVLAAWYLIYTFYAAMDTPPWLNCKEFDEPKCMVKRINVSLFQHCLEAQSLFEDDCGMKTASSCFYSREIGNNCTKQNPQCYLPWKTIVAVTMICCSVYILSIKKEKILQVIVKFYAIYVCIVILVLFGIALSFSGTWYARRISINWTSFTYNRCFNTISRGFLSVGTGTGMLFHLSHDVPFRSPATMTTVSTCLFSLFVSFMFSMIAYSGIKTMSYFHGEEENVIEIGSSLFFSIFSSMSEIMIYFEPLTIWSFVWFSVGLVSLYINFWMIYLFLKESLLNACYSANRYKKFSSLLLMMVITLCVIPFLCSDIAGILLDAIEIMQTFNSFLLSLSLYWIYGIRKHNVDIIFMIGIKANYFWKLTWFLNPILLISILSRSWDILQIHDYEESYYIKTLGLTTDVLALYIILGIYAVIVVVGIVVQIVLFLLYRRLSELISPLRSWGPNDFILSRSRSMFLPEIMTREFLYRQVRIRGYKKKKELGKKVRVEMCSSQTTMPEGTVMSSSKLN